MQDDRQAATVGLRLCAANAVKWMVSGESQEAESETRFPPVGWRVLRFRSGSTSYRRVHITTVCLGITTSCIMVQVPSTVCTSPPRMSSLNAVVNSLVRAAAAIPNEISDEDLDRHVAKLLADEAKAKEKTWNELGLGAYLGRSE